MEVEKPVFGALTKYISLIGTDEIGTWVFNKNNNGTHEHQMPFMRYSEVIYRFIDDVHKFRDDHEAFGMNQYREVLEQYGFEWGEMSMSEVDVSEMDARGVMALIMCAVRAERFCEGQLLGLFRHGVIRKWLERLKEIDEDREPTV